MIRALGESTDRGAEAARLVAELRSRVEAIKGQVALALTKPRVALLSWITPPIGAGGLLAELVRIAGGRQVVGDPAETARPLDWAHVVGVAPEIMVLAPCSLGIDRVRVEAEALRRVDGIKETPAARWGQIHAVDGRRWFSAPGPCAIRGVEILAALIHPELPWPDTALAAADSRPVALD
jgi:iron complex transport system substrate-binding protein